MRNDTGWTLSSDIDSSSTLRCISCNERVTVKPEDKSYEISIMLTAEEQESVSFFTGEYFTTSEYPACSKECFDSFRQSLVEKQPEIYCTACYDIREYCDCYCDACAELEDNCTCCKTCNSSSDDCTCCYICNKRAEDCDCCSECQSTADNCTCNNEEE